MIPAARFGDVRIEKVNGAAVTARLFSLYNGGTENVANNKEFCLFVLTDLFWQVSMHANVNWSYKEITKTKAKELFEQLGKAEVEFLGKAHRMLSEGIREFATPTALFDQLETLGPLRESNVTVPPSLPMGTHLNEEQRAAFEQVISERLSAYGSEHNRTNHSVALRSIPITAPLTSEGERYVQDLQQRFELPLTDDFMKKFHGGDTIGAESLLGKLGLVMDRFATNGPTLKLDLLVPLVPLQQELLTKYHDPARPLTAATLPNYAGFRALANEAITSMEVKNVQPVSGTYAEQAELNFTVETTERTRHIHEGLWVSIG